MPEQKITDGKWRVELNSNKNEHSIVGDGFMIATVYHDIEPSKDEGLANARAIAKVPEMIELLNKAQGGMVLLEYGNDKQQRLHYEIQALLGEIKGE